MATPQREIDLIILKNAQRNLSKIIKFSKIIDTNFKWRNFSKNRKK